MATKGLDYVSSGTEEMEPIIQHICAVAYLSTSLFTVEFVEKNP